MAANVTQGTSRWLIGPTMLKAKIWNSAEKVNILSTRSIPYSTSSEPEKNLNRAVKLFSQIPSPKGLPIVGTLLQIPRDSTKLRPFLTQRYHEFGPIYRESAGAFDFVFLYDMEEIEKLFRSEDKYPARMVPTYWKHYREVRGQADGILMSNGEPWHRMRKVIDKPLLRIKDVSGYADDVNEVVTDFLERLGNIRQADGLVPDLERELFNWSLETIGLILYEKRFGGLSDARDPEMQQFIDAIRTMFSSTVRLLALPVWIARIFFRHLYNRFIYSSDIVFRIAKKCVDEKMNEIAATKEQNRKNGAGVLSYLLTDKSLPVEEIYSNVTELMSAAVDTTSAVVLWMFQELALHLQVQDKLLAEVTSVLPDGDLPTYQDLQKMPYLKAVVKETLRKYPVGGGLGRTLKEDTEICGYLIPAKTNLQIQANVLCRLPQHYDDPDGFRPERWLRGSREHINPFTIMGFGFGTRMCVGRRVAELEMYMLLSRLIQQFHIEPAFTEPAVESMELVVKPDRPIKIKLIERK